MRLTPRVTGFRSEYPAGFKLECMAGFIGTRMLAEQSRFFSASNSLCGYRTRSPGTYEASVMWPRNDGERQ